MVKAKLRFANVTTFEKFMTYCSKTINSIVKVKCKYRSNKECHYQVILWINLSYEESQDLIFTILEKAMAYFDSGFELLYIKERREKYGKDLLKISYIYNIFNISRNYHFLINHQFHCYFCLCLSLQPSPLLMF